MPPAHPVPDRALSNLCGWVRASSHLAEQTTAFLERLSYWFRTSASLMPGTILHPLKLSATRTDLVFQQSSVSRWCFLPTLTCVMNNGGPFPTAPLLTKCSTFPEASFALISYFIFWKLVQPEVVFTMSVWFCLIFWGECGEHIHQICRHLHFSNHKNILFQSVNC